MIENKNGSAAWRSVFMWLVPTLLTILSIFVLGYASWNYGEMRCLRDDIRKNQERKLDKEQYYRDIAQIDKKLDDIFHLVQSVYKRNEAGN